ncbi:hypothetical protein BGX27_003096 [Mortierella sp. AM989]|nr:hypothetical protein BGX27_003096 [Mortierella sp. AM989]
MKDDTYLGYVIVTLGAGFESSEFKECNRDIVPNGKDPKAKPILNMEIKGSRTPFGKYPDPKKPTTSGPVRYSRHISYAAGLLTQSKLAFYTYRIRLNHIIDVFGKDKKEYQHWNEDYEAAKRIFDKDSIEGQTLRSAINSQHSYLYRRDRTTKFGALESAEDLGNLLHPKYPEGNRDLKHIVFTYSIVPMGIYFSETGTAYFQNSMSKNVMHANRAEEVCYSGEFRLFVDEGNEKKWTLWIDNNSSTYSPKKEDLPKVVDIFEKNFPDLVVEGFDHEDPTLKDICEKTKEEIRKQSPRYRLFSFMSSSHDGTKSEEEEKGEETSVPPFTSLASAKKARQKAEAEEARKEEARKEVEKAKKAEEEERTKKKWLEKENQKADGKEEG